METVRLGLFGLTHPHARAHLKTLQCTPLVAEIVLYDEDAAVVSSTRAELGDKVVAAYSDLDQALAEGRIDGAVACFRNDLNGRLCTRLLEAGLHVLSEKPIAPSAAEMEPLVELAAARGLKLGVMYQNRFHPASVDARRMVCDGVIGRPTSCEARMITSQVRFRDPGHWLFDAALSGGGILSWLGCHYIDLLCVLMGDEVAEVSAIVDTLSGEDIDVEDVGSVSLRFRSGAIGSLQVGYQLVFSKEGYMGPNYDAYMAVRGTAGRIWWNPVERPPVLHAESVSEAWSAAPARSQEYNLPQVDAYGGAYGVAYVERFVRSTYGDGEPPATGADALHVARVVEAAYESSRTGRRIRLLPRTGT
jgi:predicted dehydrogenase